MKKTLSQKISRKRLFSGIISKSLQKIIWNDMSQVKGLKELKLPVRQRKRQRCMMPAGDVGTISISACCYS